MAAFYWSTYYVPETTNVALEDMDEVFKKFGYDTASDGAGERELRLEVCLAFICS
jgi:hypothetical protein